MFNIANETQKNIYRTILIQVKATHLFSNTIYWKAVS